MKLWKRNAVVAAIVLFVCVAVYLNWSYSQDGAGETADTGKVLGEAALVGGKATDPLLKGENASSPAPSESPAAGEEGQSNSSGYFYAATEQEVRATIGHLTRRISGIAAAIHGLNRSLEQFDTDQTRLPLKGGDGN